MSDDLTQSREGAKPEGFESNLKWDIDCFNRWALGDGTVHRVNAQFWRGSGWVSDVLIARLQEAGLLDVAGDVARLRGFAASRESQSLRAFG